MLVPCLSCGLELELLGSWAAIIRIELRVYRALICLILLLLLVLLNTTVMSWRSCSFRRLRIHLVKAALVTWASRLSYARVQTSSYHLMLMLLILQLVVNDHALCVNHLVDLLSTHQILVILHWLHHLYLLDVLLIITGYQLVLVEYASCHRDTLGKHLLLSSMMADHTHACMYLLLIQRILRCDANLRVIITSRRVRLKGESRLVLTVRMLFEFTSLAICIYYSLIVGSTSCNQASVSSPVCDRYITYNSGQGILRSTYLWWPLSYHRFTSFWFKSLKQRWSIMRNMKKELK